MEPKTPEERIVAAALQQDDIRALYTWQEGQTAYNEQPIDALETRAGEEVWVSGILDRLVLTQKDNVVTQVDIIDIQTDIRRGCSAEEQDDYLYDTHRHQMCDYHSR